MEARVTPLPHIADSVEAVRRFSRFYTRRIGALEDGLLGSTLSLPQARVLFEIAQSQGLALGGLAHELRLDAGYVSRVVAVLERAGLVTKSPAPDDARRLQLSLTDAGRHLFADIDGRSRTEVGAMLHQLGHEATARVVAAMRTIETALDDKPPASRPFVLRGHRIGDMGWIVHRHGVLYAREYGWDQTFEALVARVAADFVEQYDPARHCCRMAERDGEIAGSAMVVEKSPAVAKLRLVYVEPWARGTGLGKALVEDCMSFARGARYRRMTLWTNDVLLPARRLYQRLGFEMTAAEAYRGFGKDLVGETWERDL